MKLKILVLLFITGCSFPKDPEKSFEMALEDSLQVGIVENPPYTSIQNNEPTGSEVDIIKNFAKSRNLQIQFIEGSESKLVDDLKKYKIHLVAGGFDKKTIWKKHAGTSATYDSQHVFLVPKGENKLLHELETYIFQNLKK